MANQPWRPEDTFASRLVLVRRQLGINQKQAAAACGLSSATWATWELGAHPQKMHETVAHIADGLGVDRDWLMWGGPLAQSGVRDCTDTDHLADVSWRPDDGPEQLHFPGIDDVVIDLRDRPALAVAGSQ